jgi:ADP-ribosylglycohydrolase
MGNQNSYRRRDPEPRSVGQPGNLCLASSIEHRPEPRAIEDRAIGALLGLAIGDAIGTTLEFRARDTYEALTDMVGGGPFNLKVGEWTDDTAMALALSDSLEAREDFR